MAKAKIYSPGRFSGGQGIAKNSLSVTSDRLVAIKSGYVDVAVAGDTIVGLSAETKTFDSDNQTVKKDKLQFIALSDQTQLEITIGTGTIAQANIGSKFDLQSDGQVDATASTPSQLTLVEVLTSTRGIFVRAK